VEWTSLNIETLRSNIAHVREEVIRQQQILQHFIQERKEDVTTLATSPAAPWYAAAFFLLSFLFGNKRGVK
jgi:hypothetical protein